MANNNGNGRIVRATAPKYKISERLSVSACERKAKGERESEQAKKKEFQWIF